MAFTGLLSLPVNLDLCLPCPHLEGQLPPCTVSMATLLPGRRKRDYSFHGNPVNTSATQRELPLDMGNRLDPEQGASTKGKLRKLLFLARSRPHPRTSWNQERRWANYRGRPELPKGLREDSQGSHLEGSWGCLLN